MVRGEVARRSRGVPMKPSDYEFVRGYLFAVGTLLRMHDEPTLARDMLNEIGVRTPQGVRALGKRVGLDLDEASLIIIKMRGWWPPRRKA